MRRKSGEAGGGAAEAERVGAVAEVLRAVAHPLRLRIVERLCRDEVHVAALAEELGAPPAIVSQQLRILRMNRLVGVRRQGGLAHYFLAEPRLRKLVACFAGDGERPSGGRTSAGRRRA